MLKDSKVWFHLWSKKCMNMIIISDINTINDSFNNNLYFLWSRWMTQKLDFLVPAPRVFIFLKVRTWFQIQTIAKRLCYECSQYSLSRASKTPKSFLSNSIDNNLSRKVLFQTAATPCFPIFEQSCPEPNRNICLRLFLDSKIKATVFWQRSES